MDTSPALVLPRARRWRVRAALAGALLLAATAQAQADPPGRVGRVAEVAGEVRTVDPDGAWVALPRNQPLSTGDRVITDKDGRATLQIGSSTVRVGPYSDVAILQLDDQKIRVRFDHGQMALRVRSADILGELSVDTDEGAWVPHHAGYFRFDRAPRQALAAQAWSGDLLLEAADSSLPVAAGQRAEVWREGPRQATHYRLVPVPVDAFSDWALVQDRLDDRDAAAAAASAATPEEMTGATDLARYGKWSASDDYGPVWTPATLAPDWQPYQDGAWIWMSPWGWTWVDNAPWGFAPFHYGRWVTIRGRWCWTPGRRGATRPVYAPALVGWFGGAGFAVGGAPAIGWVALGPDEAFYPGYAASPHYWDAINAPTGDRRRTPEPVKGRARFVPDGPVAYVNRGVPGAVAIVAADSLAPHAPVRTMPGMQRADRRRVLSDPVAAHASALPPPGPPAGHSALAGDAPVLKVPLSDAAAPAAAAGARPGVVAAEPAGRRMLVPPQAAPRPVVPIAPIAPIAPRAATPAQPAAAPATIASAPQRRIQPVDRGAAAVR
jgi:hypothetical protein